MYINDVRRAFAEAIKEVKAVAQPGELRPDDRGCAVGLKMADEWLIQPEIVDEVINGKEEKYLHFAGEKADRTLIMHEQRGDVSSFQSADNDNQMYPGAIVARDSHGRPHAYTCSAYPWPFDEAICLLTAYKVGNLTKEEALHIAEISSNPIFPRVAAKLPDAMETKEVEA